MGGFRALTRVKSVKKFKSHFDSDQNTGLTKNTSNTPHYLEFVKLTSEQEQRKMSNVNYKKLPTTPKQIEEVIANTQKLGNDHIVVTLQRYRDFFNPILNENKKYEEDFQTFIKSLIVLWQQYFTSNDQEVHNLHKQILVHLKELASTDRYAHVFIDFLRSKMSEVTQVLITLQPLNQINESQAQILLEEYLKLQTCFIRVLECPPGKIMDCLLQLGGQIYVRSNEILLSDTVKQSFEEAVSNEIKIMQKQQSKAVFNPILTQVCQRLTLDHPLRLKLVDFLSEKVMHPQITTRCLTNEKVSGPRLEYLQLGKQKPRPIPSHKPLIEDDFMLIEKKWKPALDQKQLKRKIKAEEKMAVRELKKDTFILQQEKQRIKTLKKQKNKKATFRGGNAPKDEV